MERVFSILVPLLPLALACGGGAAAGTTETTTTVRVGIGAGAVTGANADCDWGDPRVARAMEQTSQLVGHPVEIQFRTEGVPNPRTQFCERLFDRHMGLIPRDLENEQRRDADRFAYGSSVLYRIELDYDGTARRPEVTLDTETGTLRVLMNRSLIPRGVVRHAFREAFNNYLTATFSGATDEDLEPREFRYFFRYLDEVAQRQNTHRGEDRLFFSPQIEAIIRMIELDRRVPETDADLKPRIREWILRKADYFRNVYVHHRREIRQNAPSESEFPKAERMWTRWLNDNFDDLTDEQRFVVFPKMIVPRLGRGGPRQFNRDAFPGFDVAAQGFRIVEQWVRAGRPAPAEFDPGDKRQALFDYVVCMPRRDRQGGRRATRYCERAWYHYMLSDDRSKQQLVRAVIRRNDPAFTTAVFSTLTWVDDLPQLTDFWRAIERNEAQWGVATWVIAEEEFGRLARHPPGLLRRGGPAVAASPQSPRRPTLPAGAGQRSHRPRRHSQLGTLQPDLRLQHHRQRVRRLPGPWLPRHRRRTPALARPRPGLFPGGRGGDPAGRFHRRRGGPGPTTRAFPPRACVR